MRQMCMTDAYTTQDNFILPAPPVGGLPISQDWLDKMKLVLCMSVFWFCISSYRHVKSVFMITLPVVAFTTAAHVAIIAGWDVSTSFLA